MITIVLSEVNLYIDDVMDIVTSYNFQEIMDFHREKFKLGDVKEYVFIKVRNQLYLHNKSHTHLAQNSTKTRLSLLTLHICFFFMKTCFSVSLEVKNVSSDLIEEYLNFKRSAEWKTSHINKASWKRSTKKNVRRIIALEDRFN